MSAVRNLLATITIALAVWAVSATFSTPSQAQFSDTWEFLKAVEEADYLEMRNRISKGANVNRKNADGFPAIIIAAEKRDQELIRFLLDQGVKINATTAGRKETALMRAARNRKQRIVRRLLEADAGVDATDFTGKTALGYARDARARRVVRLLEEAGARF